MRELLPSTQEYLEKLHTEKGYEFESDQKCVIDDGFRDNLTEEQITYYSDPECNHYTMSVYECLFKEGLAVNQIKVAKDLAEGREREWSIFRDLCSLLENGHSEEEVRFCGDKKLNYDQVEQLCIVAKRMPFDQMKACFSTPRDPGVISAVFRGLKKGVSVEEMLPYIDNSGYGHMQLNRIWDGIKAGYTLEQRSLYERPEMKAHCMTVIQAGIKHGLSIENIRIYADPDFDSKQMVIIERSLKEGMPYDILKMFADPQFNVDKMRLIKSGYDNGLSKQQLFELANPRINTVRMKKMLKEMLLDVKNGEEQANDSAKDSENISTAFAKIYHAVKIHAPEMTLEQKYEIIKALM